MLYEAAGRCASMPWTRVMRWVTTSACLLLVVVAEAWGQCPDFTDLTAPGVQCLYGYRGNPGENMGIMPGRHAVITCQDTDPHTDGNLLLLPEGESRVVKLGNSETGSRAERIVYTFTVDTDYSLLMLKFAVVFEDPGHASIAQPRFSVRVLNDRGTLVEDCAAYDVSANGSLDGFRQGEGQVLWRPWTLMAVDLVDYVGQTVRVEFTTYDCGHGGHWGYAYYTGRCVSNKLQLVDCTEGRVTLAAPKGFESYEWDNGCHSDTAVYSVSDSTTTATCRLGSAMGCECYLSATMSSAPTSGRTVIYDTVCQGDPYSANGYNLPPQMEAGTFVFRNTAVDLENCQEGMTTSLVLFVKQRYYPISAQACHGEDYLYFGFHIYNLEVGTYEDTLIIPRPGDCDSVSVLHLRVSPSFEMSSAIMGDTVVCRGRVYEYRISSASWLTSLHWNANPGVMMYTGEYGDAIYAQFTDSTPSPTTITLTAVNGCGEGTISLRVWPHDRVTEYYEDTACWGTEYSSHGFHLPRLTETGYHTFIDHYLTTFGCDSDRVVSLHVMSVPQVGLESTADVLCPDEEVTLRASASISRRRPALVRVGDILCEDGSFVRPEIWPCGRTAVGVVGYVDTSGRHGFVVSLEETVCAGFGGTYPGDSVYFDTRAALSDTAGYANTLRIRNGGDVWNIDLPQGWYVPTTGQLYLLFSNILYLNPVLEIVGGTPLSLGNGFYRSSSLIYTGGFYTAWFVPRGGVWGTVRTMKSF